MAVKNVCPKCKQNFSAPESYLGKKIECPKCGHRSVLRTPEELRELEEVQAVRQRKMEEEWQKLALIERMELRRKRRSRPYYEAFGTGESAVRHFNPNAPSRFLRFRALSELLVVFAYLDMLFVLVGVGLTIYLKAAGVISLLILLLMLVGWFLIGTFLYFAFKFLGEAAFLLSDIGDQHHDMVQLLLDLRENTEQPSEPEV